MPTKIMETSFGICTCEHCGRQETLLAKDLRKWHPESATGYEGALVAFGWECILCSGWTTFWNSEWPVTERPGLPSAVSIHVPRRHPRKVS